MFRLKEIREEKGVLQKDLAAALNRTRACISSWEQGKTEPAIEDLIKLADFFEVSIDVLLGHNQPSENVSKIKFAHWDTFRHWLSKIILIKI